MPARAPPRADIVSAGAVRPVSGAGRFATPGPPLAPADCYISRASYTSTLPPPVSTGQPLALADASLSESAVTME